MSLSWKIGTMFGIPVRLHITMIIVPLIALGWVEGFGPMSLFVAALGVVLVFGSVLLHELGHALTGRRFGVHTHDIVLTPIGGMARMVNLPTRPASEIIIAVAGPAVSLLLAAASFATMNLLAFFSLPALIYDGLAVVFWVNLMLGLFNLIPALPMDGGRILRGVLATRYDFLTATTKAARVGKILAIVGFSVGGVALLGRVTGFHFPLSPWNIILISAFVYFSAGQEERVARWREAQRQTASGGAGPFRWTWNSASTGSGRSRGWGQEHSSTDPRSGWTSSHSAGRPSPRGPRVVIDGGKAEVVSRKDPDEK